MDKTLEMAFHVNGNVLPPGRAQDFERLYSQTSILEREALYAAARYFYTGEGEILDIGTAAGGSTFCLAAGVLDSCLADKRGRVHGFDLFDGFSLKVFAERIMANDGLSFGSDIELFDWQTKAVSAAIVRTRADLVTDAGLLTRAGKVEIAHIDAAKTLSLWQVIFGAIAPTVIPGKTIWIFQDFEVISLPWQIYGLGELLKVGKFIGGARYGTMFFQFNDAIAHDTVAKITADRFSLSEKIENVDAVYGIIEEGFPQLFLGSLTLDDLRTGTMAYCHGMAGDTEKARKLFRTLSDAFRCHPGSKGHMAMFG